MFRNPPATEPARDVATPPEPLVPLSVLSLDLPEPSVGGWPLELARRGIEIVVDDIGRDSISRADAKQLILQKREDEARKRAFLAQQEQEAVEADRAWRAALPKGTPWWEFDGVTPAEAWAAAELAAAPRRRSLLEESLDGEESMVYHSLPRDEG
jgi:hypothetical protein